MNKEIQQYNNALQAPEKAVCDLLASLISEGLNDAEQKIWHAHPVWFLNGNPIVGYSKLKAGIRLMFWSGADFGEERLKPGSGKFKDASVNYTAVEEIDRKLLKRWLKLAREIQWDYKNIVKRKGKLLRLSPNENKS